MLRRLRTAPAVRLAVCLAALLSVGAAFGLHPEPAEGFSASAASFAKSIGPQASHGCVACLNHGLALASTSCAIVFSGLLPKPSALPALPVPHGRLAGTELPGRSPPFDRS